MSEGERLAAALAWRRPLYDRDGRLIVLGAHPDRARAVEARIGARVVEVARIAYLERAKATRA
jgi:hypothetical protein